MLILSFIRDRKQPYLIVRNNHWYSNPTYSTLERIEKVANYNSDYVSTTHLWYGQINLIVEKREGA